MKVCKVVAWLFGMAFLSGCSTTFIEQVSEPKDYSQLYVRGVFTWWEADENYRLKLDSEGNYVASAKLIADGQPYDFKFADANWSPGLNCGSSLGSQSVEIDLTQSLQAECNNPQQAQVDQGSFKFTPKETGTYLFKINFEGNYPVVSVDKVL